MYNLSIYSEDSHIANTQLPKKIAEGDIKILETDNIIRL